MYSSNKGRHGCKPYILGNITNVQFISINIYTWHHFELHLVDIQSATHHPAVRAHERRDYNVHERSVEMIIDLSHVQ